MHGDHMRHVRSLYGETQTQFARRLGFEGPDLTLERKVRRFEKGEQQIRGPLAALLRLLETGCKKPDIRRR